MTRRLIPGYHTERTRFTAPAWLERLVPNQAAGPGNAINHGVFAGEPIACTTACTNSDPVLTPPVIRCPPSVPAPRDLLTLLTQLAALPADQRATLARLLAPPAVPAHRVPLPDDRLSPAFERVAAGEAVGDAGTPIGRFGKSVHT